MTAFRDDAQQNAKIGDLPLRFLQAHMQKMHDMHRVGNDLEKIVARSVRKAPAGEGPVLAWPLACGGAVAGRTRALAFADGVLRVEVANRGWQVELQALAPRYVAALNRYVAENVTRVEFVVGPRG